MKLAFLGFNTPIDMRVCFVGCLPNLKPSMAQNFNPNGYNYIQPIPDAVSATRRPVQGARSQDSDPSKNHGKTYVTENNIQPSQPNPSSLRQG